MATILLIEDTELVRKAVKAVLEREGHQVVEASDGLAGLQLLEDQGQFDLIVTDVWMPKMDGVSFLKEIRARDEKAPVLVITGGGPTVPMESTASLAETYGCDALLFKPIENDHLIETVNTLL